MRVRAWLRRLREHATWAREHREPMVLGAAPAVVVGLALGLALCSFGCGGDCRDLGCPSGKTCTATTYPACLPGACPVDVMTTWSCRGTAAQKLTTESGE